MKRFFAWFTAVSMAGALLACLSPSASPADEHRETATSPASTPATGPQTQPATTSAPVGQAAFKDGVYMGTGKGFRGNVDVVVRVKNGRLNAVAILRHSDDQAWFNRAKALTAKIVDKQGVQGVDTVSGATYSSKGILQGAAEAIENARVSPATNPSN